MRCKYDCWKDNGSEAFVCGLDNPQVNDDGGREGGRCMEGRVGRRQKRDDKVEKTKVKAEERDEIWNNEEGGRVMGDEAEGEGRV